MSTTLAELTTAGRCDSLRRAGLPRVTPFSGGEPLFCAHHARAHEDKLKQVALNIQDETRKLS